MAFDADWLKVLGDDAVSMWTPNEGEEWVVPSDAAPTAEAQATLTPEQVAEQAQANIVADEVLWTDVPPTDVPLAGEEEVVLPAEALPTRTPEEEADAIIKELLWDVEEATAEVTAAVADVAQAKEWEDFKKKSDELELKVEDMTTKMWTLTQAYRDLLDQKNNLETINEEYTRKMQIISNNSMLQDLLRWLYLKDKDANAMTNVWDTLKAMLKEYDGIDVNALVAKTRGWETQPSWDSMAAWWASSMWGIFWEGDMIPL